MRKDIIENYFWRMIQFFFKSIIPMFINFYGAKILLPIEFGSIVYGLTFLSVMNLLSNFGISTSVMKEAAELESYDKLSLLNKIFPSTAVISLSVTMLIILIAIVVLDNIPSYYYWSILYLLFNPLTAILDGLFVGTKEFKKISKSTIVASLVFLPISFFLIKFLREEGVIASYALFYTMLFIFYFASFPFKNGRFDKRLSKKIMKYAVIIGFGSVSFFLYSRIDIFILKEFGYVVAIGNYELVMRVFEIINIPVLLLAQVLAPNFVTLFTNEKYFKIKNKSLMISFSVFVLGVFVSLIMYFLIPFLIKSYYPLYNTKEFIHIVNVLLLTIPLKFVGLFMTVAVLTPIGYAKLVSYSTFIFGIINVALDFIFIDYFGFIGVFYATFLVHSSNIALQSLIFYFNFKRKLCL